MAPRVTARPPRRKVDDRPAGPNPELQELNNWIDETMNKPAPPTAAKAVATKKVSVAIPVVRPKVKLAPVTPTPPPPAAAPTPAVEEDDSEYEEVATEVAPAKGKSGGKAKAAATKPGKRAKKVIVLSHAATSKVSSSLLDQTLKQSRVEYGDFGIAAAGEAGSLVMGIKMPFIMQYILQSTVFPLSRMMQLVGMAKSNKSALAFEIAGWFARSAGVAYLFENESKYSEDFAESILGYEDETGRRVFGHLPSKTQEDWQAKLTGTMFKLKMRMDKGFIEKRKKRDGKVETIKHPPVGRCFPVLLLVDSISGTISEEKFNKIEKRGFASRDYATEAMSNQDFLKKTSPDLVGYPLSLLVVNHLKKNKAENGQHIERKKPGGTHIGFQESYELEMTKVRSLKFVDDRPGAPSLEIRGNQIKIKCQKSALGEEEREAEVDLTWCYNRSPVDGLVRQYSRWQWEAATVNLLANLEGTRRTRVFDVVDVRSATEDRWWSKKLGVSQKAPVSRAELGALIDKDPEIVRQLGELFAIKHRTEFVSGNDYTRLLQMKVRDREKLLNL